LPRLAAASESEAATVVLPTPPFPETTATREDVKVGDIAPIIVAGLAPLSPREWADFRTPIMRAVRAPALGFVCAVGLALAPVTAWGQSVRSPGPVVDVIEVSGLIERSVASYVEKELRNAERDGAQLVVLQIDSEGGVKLPVDATGLPRLARRVIDSRVPVAAWVGPRDARAGSTALLLVSVADVAVVGPSARVGPGVPFDLAKEDRDAKRPCRAVAQTRAACAVGIRTLGASAAVRAAVARFSVPSIALLLERLDGQTLDGKPLRLKKDEVVVRFHRPGPVSRMAQTLASASLLYVLLLAGAMLVTFELFQPGFGVAGVSAVAVLAAAAYGLTVAPAHGWGLGLICAGTVLYAIDVAIHELAVASAAGTAALVVGSLGLFPGGAFRVPAWLIGVGVGASLIFYAPVMTLVRRNQRRPAGRPTQRLIGKAGEVRSVLNPEGYVWVNEALWRARGPEGERIRVGEPVVVVGLDATLLRVTRSSNHIDS
jgi:membrane-bound serine protease (ClpP class)